MCIRDRYQVNDKAYNKLNFSIHNYFFAKALDQVRPGGVVAFVTSRYTMDAKDSTCLLYTSLLGFLLFFYPKLKGAQNTMPTKAELYAQMAEKVATQLTGSWQRCV